MGNGQAYQALTEAQIGTLEAQGCTAPDWSQVRVDPAFDPAQVRDVQFSGHVQIGDLSGSIETVGLAKPGGLYHAILANCTVGAGCRIANVGVHIANYDIEDGVCIENIGVMQTNPGASFGNGIEISVLNEAGGREVILFDQLSAQFAYMMCVHRFRDRVVERLRTLALDYTASVQSDRGRVGAGAHVCSVKEIVD